VGLIFRLFGPAGIALSLVLVALLGLQVHKTHHQHASAVSWQQKYEGEHGAFLQTIINYSKAAEQARSDDAANQARVEREAAAVGHERQTSYEARIADARARAERVQQPHGTAGADQGGPGAAPVPGVPGPAGGPSGPAPEAGLPPSDALIATEQAIQLDELIKWVKGISGIDLTGHTTPVDQAFHPGLSSPPSSPTESR
jgi:hypothetical protein